MATMCKRCGLHIPDGVRKCSMCGGLVTAAEPAGAMASGASTSGVAASASPVATPLYLGASSSGSSKWMVVLGISLAATPLFRLNSIFSIEIPNLYGEQYQAYLASHPGLVNLLYFRIAMNGILIISALVLNFLFYTKRKAFPTYMIAYIAATVLFLVADTSAVNYMFPDANLGRSYVALVRSFIWAGALIPYLLTSAQVKSRFVR